jgi:hypothetical protein
VFFATHAELRSSTRPIAQWLFSLFLPFFLL